LRRRFRFVTRSWMLLLGMTVAAWSGLSLPSGYAAGSRPSPKVPAKELLRRIDRGPVVLSRVTVVGDVVLKRVVAQPFSCTECVFTGAFRARNASFRQRINVAGSRFGGRVDLGGSRFEREVFLAAMGAESRARTSVA